jgi:L-fuconate dehydratase
VDITISAVDVADVRFPTSRTLAGSDAMNEAPDYSAAYVTLTTDSELSGYGMTFTIGRGTEIVCQAVRALAPLVVGRNLADIRADPGRFWREITGDSQLRWIGPEKGAIHLATAALVNAVWDLWARAEGKPLWKLVADMSPEELVRCVDFRYLTDALTPGEAVALLERHADTRAEREQEMRRDGFPAYSTSVGWLGFSDDEVRRRCRAAVAGGWSHVKMKVGGDPAKDLATRGGWRSRRAPTTSSATARSRAQSPPWIATGEHCHSRTMFKQFMQAGGMAVCQLDACRLGGVNEVLAVLLLAAKFGIPVCPHAGGVGLSEYVQHLSLIDYIVVSADLTDRVIEYVDELHEHFVEPCRMANGRYIVPEAPGYSIEMHPTSVQEHAFPHGGAWR